MTPRTLSFVAALLVAILGSSSALAMYHPGMGRFMQRDSAGYIDGMNVHARYANIHQGLDPSGYNVVQVPPGSSMDSIGGSLLDFFGGLGAGGADRQYVFGPDSSLSKRFFMNHDFFDFAEEWLKNDAKSYCGGCCGDDADPNLEPYFSGLNQHQYTATNTDFFRDVFSNLGWGLHEGVGSGPRGGGDWRVGQVGSFTVTWSAFIDCKENVAEFSARIFNRWSVQSLLRDPITRNPLTNTRAREVDMIVFVNESTTACDEGG